jgi:hypothetical protein
MVESASLAGAADRWRPLQHAVTCTRHVHAPDLITWPIKLGTDGMPHTNTQRPLTCSPHIRTLSNASSASISVA